LNLFLIRHGDAEKSSPQKKDSERELTHNGRESTKIAAGYWKHLIPGFDYIISSPYKRSLETAEIIAQVFEYSNGIVTDTKLKPGSRTDDLVELTQIYSGKNIAVVGHQPDLSDFVSDLISGSNALVEFRKSAIAKISFSSKIKKGKGTLDYLIPPDIFLNNK
jgi:phosphohistidine phosphatase